MHPHVARKIDAPPITPGAPDHWLSTAYEHGRIDLDASGIAWLVLDKAGARVNTLNESVFAELERMLAEIRAAKPRALVVRSAKQAGFIAGADLRMLARLADEADARQRIEAAHALVDQFEALPFPTIAVVHGHCLGGGLELTLALRYRIARPDATFALPEVRLGLHPGLGGTARLPRQIAPLDALKLMLTGKTINAMQARALGLVDVVCEEPHIAKAVQLAANGALPHRAAGHSRVVLMSIKPARALIAGRIEAESEKRVRREHYPAPYALLDVWREHGDSKQGMLAAERDSFARLHGTPTAQNLIRVFFLRERLKTLADGDRTRIKHVHVIGAGAMGGDIAAWCALHGYTVTLDDTSKRTLAEASQRAARLFDRAAAGPARRRAFDRFIPDFKSLGARHADLVIEAIPEDLEAKLAVYRRIESEMKRTALLATNTSSLSLDRLRAPLERPERFIGLHFFNPVSRMQVVEVVAHDRADADAAADARAFVARLNRLAVPVRSSPGFLVNRVLMPYLLEAVALHDAGVPAERIDAAAMAFGMPIGPLALADQVGLDVCVQVAEALKRELALPEIPAWLREKVQQGALGKKTGAGIYEYGRDALHPTAHGKADMQLADRLVLPLLNACVTCLRERVVADEGILDGAIVFATGFAPFRGGPLHYARGRGIDDLVERLHLLAAQYGARYAPDSGWDLLRSA